MNPANMIKQWNSMVFSLLWTGHKDCQPGRMNPVRHQKDYSLTFIVKGKGYVRINDVVYPAEPGKLFAIVKGDVFEKQSGVDEPLQYYVIKFSAIHAVVQQGEWCFNPIEAGEFALRGMYMLQDSAPITMLFERIHALSQRKSHSVQMRKKILFHELLLAIALDLRAQMITGGTTQAIEQTISYMVDHYHTPLSLPQLAAMAQLSVSHYSRLFKRYTGFAPMEYITHIRIDKSKELLVADHKLKSVARSVGIQDEFYFSRLFKKHVGVSPTQYARNTHS